MISNIDQLTRIERKLDALLKSANHLHWVGSYAHGRTSDGDPYIVLFPSSAKMEFQICRVYEPQWGKLPAFVETAVPMHIKPSKKSPAKNSSIPCPAFQVVTYDGRDTQMGPEKRFGHVTVINDQTATAGQPPPAAKRPSGKDWHAEAAASTNAFMFDTAIVKAMPWYKDASAAEQFRDVLFGEWNPAEAAAVAAGMAAYAKARIKKQGHNAAKKPALAAYGRLVNAQVTA